MKNEMSTNKMQNQINVNDIIFGVTRNHAIVPMFISQINDEFDGEFQSVRVEPLSRSKHNISQVKLAFNDILLFEDGLNKSNVFVCEQKAKEYAIKKLESERSSLLSKLESLDSAKAKLI